MGGLRWVAMCIFDLSKTLKYDFHIINVKNNYGDNTKLLFTDNRVR